MIVKETIPNSVSPLSQKYFDLSDEEKEKVKNICNELKEIFQAESVAFEIPYSSVAQTNDYLIHINRGLNIGYTL